MISSIRIAALALSGLGVLQAATPDISNLKNCISEVRYAATHAPGIDTFDPYVTDYQQLLADLHKAAAHLPYVYQQVASGPLIQFLQKLGEDQFLEIFASDPTDEETAVYQQIIPDAALAILSYEGMTVLGINAFQEVVSDIYDGFLSNEARVGKQMGKSIDPPTYGTIPPLVKFGDPDAGPYTWPGDATKQVLGMGCGIVSLPPAQIKGGLIAWSTLGHETGGHDVTHADKGLLDELAQKVYAAVLRRFNSTSLANYWANCIDESTADVCGYLHMGPSLGIGLIGYFRALGNGKLRSIGSTDDPHPIDLLRGYLAAAAVKRLHFKDAATWSQTITKETQKDNAALRLADQNGRLFSFPVSFVSAVASADVVAEVIMQSKLSSLQGHSLQELQDWKDQDQTAVDNLVSILKINGHLPANLQGPGFYAAYVVAAATQAALQKGANISMIFNEMQNFLAEMHLQNPTWSKMPTAKSMALLEQGLKGMQEERASHALIPRLVQPAMR
ncbi:MAG: hypothetical protein V4494_01690 [Chlamydiota bacterium]